MHLRWPCPHDLFDTVTCTIPTEESRRLEYPPAPARAAF